MLCLDAVFTHRFAYTRLESKLTAFRILIQNFPLVKKAIEDPDIDFEVFIASVCCQLFLILSLVVWLVLRSALLLASDWCQ